jgi:DNA-binding transcriptional ArsR family regulator
MSIESHRTLTGEAEISAYLHHTRMAILAALHDERATISQIAERLGVHPANLTRHVRTLEAAGLVVLVEKRETGRNLEKYYEASARSFDVAPEARGLRAPHRIALSLVRSDLSAALARIDEDDRRPVVALLGEARISFADAERFAAELSGLVSSFSSRTAEDGETFHLNVSLYPAEPVPGTAAEVRLSRNGGAA